MEIGLQSRGRPSERALVGASNNDQFLVPLCSSKNEVTARRESKMDAAAIVHTRLYHSRPLNYPSTSIYYSYICCALPQRSRLSIDRLSRCHHRLPTCLLAITKCNLSSSALPPSPPPSQKQHHVRRFVPIPKCGRIRAKGHLPSACACLRACDEPSTAPRPVICSPPQIASHIPTSVSRCL